MKKKALLAIFAAFTISATMFTVGCGEFNTGGGFFGGIFSPTPDNGGSNNNDNSDRDDDTDNNYNTGKPEFTITNQNGDWMAQGKIAVLDESYLMPGTAGEYQLVIKSGCTETLTYRFALSEYLNNVSVDNPFIMYRVKFNGAYLGDEWHYAGFEYGAIQILPDSKQAITVEWKFPFEISDDTDEEFKGKQLALNIFIWGEENLEIG